MSILLYIIMAILVIVAAMLLYANTRPNTFRVERSLDIKAPATKIYEHVADFHKWKPWSPWEELDPGMARTYSGPETGKGSAYAWEGNKKVGAGRMEILDHIPPDRVHIRLDILRPFKAQNQIEITLKEYDGSTSVSWAMFGPSPLISKIMGLFINMDQIIGKDFERGLKRLRTLTES